MNATFESFMVKSQESEPHGKVCVRACMPACFRFIVEILILCNHGSRLKACVSLLLLYVFYKRKRTFKLGVSRNELSHLSEFHIN